MSAQDTEAIRAARERAIDGLRWCEDWRAGMFSPAPTDDGWTVEMHGLVGDYEDLCRAYLEATERDRLVARLEAAERVGAEAERFLDLDLGYLSEPTREALQPLIAALAAAVPGRYQGGTDGAAPGETEQTP